MPIALATSALLLVLSARTARRCNLAALHMPDLVAGGYDSATLGLRSVNSSIGSQLRPDLLGVDLRAYVAWIPPQLRPITRVNVTFRLEMS